MEELPWQWKDFVTVPIYKKGTESDCYLSRNIIVINFIEINLSTIVHSKLTPYGDEFSGDHMHGF
jgi:hypothetical protein